MIGTCPVGREAEGEGDARTVKHLIHRGVQGLELGLFDVLFHAVLWLLEVHEDFWSMGTWPSTHTRSLPRSCAHTWLQEKWGCGP